MISLDIYYRDAFQVYELLDSWNPRGPPTPRLLGEWVHRQQRRNNNNNHHRQLGGRSNLVICKGRTLLHQCLMHYPDREDLVQILLDAYPEASSIRDDNGMLPIHAILVSWKKQKRPASLDSPSFLKVLRSLVTRKPAILREKLVDGSLPLHLVVENPWVDTKAINCVVQCFPEATRIHDKAGRLPFHRAVDPSICCPRIVKILLRNDAFLMTSESLAQENGPSSTILSRFLEEAHTWKNSKSFELDLDAESQQWQLSNIDAVVAMLVSACPGALRKDASSKPSPLAYACAQDASLSQIFSLLREWPEQIMPVYASSIF